MLSVSFLTVFKFYTYFSERLYHHMAWPVTRKNIASSLVLVLWLTYFFHLSFRQFLAHAAQETCGCDVKIVRTFDAFPIRFVLARWRPKPAAVTSWVTGACEMYCYSTSMYYDVLYFNVLYHALYVLCSLSLPCLPFEVLEKIEQVC